MTTVGRNISCKIWVKWYTASSYSDEGANLSSFSGQIRLNPPFTSILANRSMVDQVSITLHNKDNRYSSLLSSAALYSETSAGIWYQSQMYIEVSVDGGSNYYTIFTGLIKGMTESTKTGKEVGQVVLDCRSKEEGALNQKLDSTYADFVATKDGDETESEILARWLTAAGYSSGDWDLDPGLFVIDYAWLNGESPVEQGWDLAAACGGRFYLRHSDGKFIYESAENVLGKSVVTSIARSDYVNLRVKYPDVDLFKQIDVTVYDHSLLTPGAVFTLSKPIQVAAGATVVVNFALDKPVYQYIALSFKAATTGAIDITSDVTITSTYLAQKLSFSIVNANTSAAAYVRLMTFQGQAVDTDSTEVVTKVSSDSFWDHVTERKRTISNKYVATRAQASGLAEMLIVGGGSMLTTLEIVDCLGNNQLKVGDIISVLDAKIMDSNSDYFVTSISFRYSSAGYLQTIECVELAQLYPYYGVSPGGYGFLGSMTLGSSGGSRGRLFF